MSKAELVAAVQKSLGKETSSAEADRTVDAVIMESKQGLKRPKAFNLSVLGLSKLHPESTQGRQSKDRGKDQDQGSKMVKFVPGAAFKKIL